MLTLSWVSAIFYGFYFLLRFDNSANPHAIKNHNTKNRGTNKAVSAKGIQTKAASKKATAVIMIASVVLMIFPLCVNRYSQLIIWHSELQELTIFLDFQTVNRSLPTVKRNVVSYHCCVEVSATMIIELGERLKMLRTENHLRQDQVARLINVDKSSISLYETGMRQPSYATLVRLANVFNVSTDYLLGRINSSPIDLSGLTAAEAAMINQLVTSMTKKNKELEELKR